MSILKLPSPNKTDEIESLRNIIKGLEFREVSWLYTKIYSLENAGLNPNEISKSDINHKGYRNSLLTYYRGSESPLPSLEFHQEEYRKYNIDTSRFQWFINKPRIMLFLLNTLRNMGIRLETSNTSQLANTVLAAIDSNFIKEVSDSRRFIISSFIDDRTEYVKNWQNFLDFQRNLWEYFDKSFETFRWIRRNDIKLIDWLYTYRNENKESFLVDYYRPLVKDYDGKHEHIIVSLNLIDNYNFINRTITKGKYEGCVVSITPREDTIRRLRNAWERYKGDQRKKLNKQPIDLSKRTFGKLEELMKRDNKTAKQIITIAIERYYSEREKLETEMSQNILRNSLHVP